MKIKDVSYRKNEERINTFMIRPFLDIVNEHSYNTSVWPKYLFWFWDREEKCLCVKEFQYWVRYWSIVPLPPYYKIKSLWYKELVQKAMNANAKETLYILER